MVATNRDLAQTLAAGMFCCDLDERLRSLGGRPHPALSSSSKTFGLRTPAGMTTCVDMPSSHVDLSGLPKVPLPPYLFLNCLIQHKIFGFSKVRDKLEQETLR
jgi:hypothetical protein